MKVLFLIFLSLNTLHASEVVVGTKAFTEGYVLGELTAQTIERNKLGEVNRKFGLGGTGILVEALKAKQIDIYTEYTGTISEAILKKPELKDFDLIQRELSTMGLEMSRSLGFSNTYALAVHQDFARTHNLKKISDLKKLAPDLRLAFSHEFMTRADGFQALRAAYKLAFREGVQSLEHSLAYQAMESGSVDLIDVYTTDAKIEQLKLQVLEDDLHFFPVYEAVLLTRKDFIQNHPSIWKELKNLEGTLSEPTMIRLNSEADLRGISFARIVSSYFSTSVGGAQAKSSWKLMWERVSPRLSEHLGLVGIALLVSVILGIPLGILSRKNRTLGQFILLSTGIFQTIPSMALLCFLIPLFGIGQVPAIIALCLYGVMPVVLNTFVGLKSIDPHMLETAQGLGLTPWQQLRIVELPLASRNILAGIKTSAIVGIGTATLAALIGAGGLGALILSGLAINDMNSILLGAIPAAILSLLVHGFFEVLDDFFIPKGIR